MIIFGGSHQMPKSQTRQQECFKQFKSPIQSSCPVYTVSFPVSFQCNFSYFFSSSASSRVGLPSYTNLVYIVHVHCTTTCRRRLEGLGKCARLPSPTGFQLFFHSCRLGGPADRESAILPSSHPDRTAPRPQEVQPPHSVPTQRAHLSDYLKKIKVVLSIPQHSPLTRLEAATWEGCVGIINLVSMTPKVFLLPRF